MNTQTYTVNIRTGVVNITRVDVSQGDTGRTLVFKLYDGLIPFTPPTGSTVTIVGRKPSGLGFSETCTVSGNTAVIDTTLAMTQEAGKFPVELRIESDTRSIGTANFMMHVEPSPHPEGTTDGTTEEARTVLEQCEAYAELAQEAAEAASGDYTEIKSDVEDLEDRVEALESGGGGSGLTDAVKTALLQLAQKVAYIDDDGQDYYDDLYDALYPPADLVSISAVYTQSGTVYDTDALNSLKSDLVVTALMSDQTTQTITDYTLSGTLTAGTSTITVSYGGKTTTFTVTVTHFEIQYLYNWDFTQSLVDSVSQRSATVGSKSGVSEPTRDSNGLTFDAATQYAYLGSIDPAGKTFEIDVSNLDFKGSTSYHVRFFSNMASSISTAIGQGCIVWKHGEGWRSYGFADSTSQDRTWSSNYWSADLSGATVDVINAFSGKTVKVVYHSDGHTKDLYLDGVYKGTISDVYFNNYASNHKSDLIYIAGLPSLAQSSGDQCYDMTITGVRVYSNNE